MSLSYELSKSDFYTFFPILTSHALLQTPDQQVQPSCYLEPSPVDSYLSPVWTWRVFPTLDGIILKALHHQTYRHTHEQSHYWREGPSHSSYCSWGFDGSSSTPWFFPWVLKRFWGLVESEPLNKTLITIVNWNVTEKLQESTIHTLSFSSLL